jgi:hypothetical protein
VHMRLPCPLPHARTHNRPTSARIDTQTHRQHLRAHAGAGRACRCRKPHPTRPAPSGSGLAKLQPACLNGGRASRLHRVSAGRQVASLNFHGAVRRCAARAPLPLPAGSSAPRYLAPLRRSLSITAVTPAPSRRSTPPHTGWSACILICLLRATTRRSTATTLPITHARPSHA